MRSHAGGKLVVTVAHIAKYKAHSVGHMLAHYRRDPSCFERDNIDRDRVALDYSIGFVKGKDGKYYAQKADRRPSWDTVKRRIERVDSAAAEAGKRKTRKDAVVLADLVITLPKNVPEKDAEKFFAQTYFWLARKLGGPRNLMGGFVHRDEVRTGERAGEPVRDHMHVPFTPILDGRFNYKQMCPRSFYQTMHRELGDYLEKYLGYRPEIELSEDKKLERAISQVKKENIDAARKAIIAPAEEHRAAVMKIAEDVSKEVYDARHEHDAIMIEVYDAQSDVRAAQSELDDIKHEIAVERSRLECLRQANDGIEEHVEQLESLVADVGRYESESRAGKVSLISRIADRADRIRAAVGKRISQLKDMILIAELRRGATKPAAQRGCVAYAPDFFRGRQAASAAQDRARATEQARTANQSHTRDSERRRGR